MVTIADGWVEGEAPFRELFEITGVYMVDEIKHYVSGWAQKEEHIVLGINKCSLICTTGKSWWYCIWII